MTTFLNDVSSEILEKSLNNREHLIDWSSLKLFQYKDCDTPTALIGKSVKGRIEVRLSARTEPDLCNRPFAVFYKQKKDKKIIQEVYYLSNEECVRFQSYFERKH